MPLFPFFFFDMASHPDTHSISLPHSIPSGSGSQLQSTINLPLSTYATNQQGENGMDDAFVVPDIEVPEMRG